MTTPDPPFTCPRCHAPTSPADVHCSACGVNLVMAVARAASQTLSAARPPEVGLPYEGDRHLPLFGEFLLRSGDITPDRLALALERQRSTPGQPRTIGQVLLEMGAVNRDQLDRASLAQMRELHEVLEESREQVTLLTDRIQYLENILNEMVRLNQSATTLIAGLSSELEAPLQQLKTSGMAEDEAALQALADLDNVIGQLRRSFLPGDPPPEAGAGE